MRVHRGYRFRLYPTHHQEELLRRALSVCRLVYSLALEQRRDHWREYKRQTGNMIGYTSQARELTALRAEVPWIRAVSQTMQQQALRDLDGAFQRFFRGEARYPRPRRRGENDGVRFMAREAKIATLNGMWSTVPVPNVGAVRFRTSRATAGRCPNVTVLRDALGWHVSVACEREIVPPVHCGPAVGVDVGVVHSATNVPARCDQRYRLPAAPMQIGMLGTASPSRCSSSNRAAGHRRAWTLTRRPSALWCQRCPGTS